MKSKLSVAVCVALAGVLAFLANCAGPQPSKEQIVALVDKAAALVERDGEKAFAEFRKRDSEWFRGDVYVFVDDMEGKNLCHPAKPELEGQNLLDMKDAKGKEFLREMIELLKTKDAGWVEYAWPKPGQTGSSRKASYIKKAKCGDKTVLVGSGLYVD
ncbi:MAG: cache domain-containing protein [Verrucomicrobia bacterium]|nr:cache domain-containing protein [Verrucomicrobiota bacterium]